MSKLIKNKTETLSILKRISNEPLKKDSHLFGQFKGIKIIDAVEQWKEDIQNPESYPAIML